MDLSDRVTIIAIGVNDYKYLKKLKGSVKDIKKIKNILIEDTKTALFKNDQLIILENPNSSKVREILTNYVSTRTAYNDILILYFSGHGASLLGYDFGLCTTDTCINQLFNITVPTSVIRFNTIVEALSLVKVEPVIIIDACYSGKAGESIDEVYQQLKVTVNKKSVSSYVLLCSCMKLETTIDDNAGGMFSNILYSICKKGILGNKDKLTIKDIFIEIKKEVEKQTVDINPQYFFSGTIGEFDFVRNVNVKHREEILTNGQKQVLNVLWNNGNPRKVTISELQKLGSTQHTTYSKLAYSPIWALITKNRSKTIILSERGVQFFKGEIKIPIKIRRNPETQEWEPAPNTEYTGCNDL